MVERFKLSLAGREKIAYLIIGAAWLILVGGLINLQFFKHRELQAQSESNRIRVVPIISSRGEVYDQEGRIIIDSRPSYTVSVVPAEEVKIETITNLAALLELDTTEVRRRIRKNLISRYQPAAVMRDVPFEKIAVLEEQNIRFPGVSYQIDRVRKYSDGLGSESFTGYVGEVSVDDLKGKEQANYRLGSTIGKKGLERNYDLILRGREGTDYIEVSANGQIIGSYNAPQKSPAISGADLRLTIDNDIQRACFNALDTFCCGAIVVMDPRDGGILAMTSYPGYDANIFSSVIPDDLWQQISSDSLHPLLNRPMTGLYPPGSTVKFVTVGAALEEKLITANTTLKSCIGGYQFGNRFFRCWDEGGHGTLGAAASLEQSCDVFLYQLGVKLGINELSRYYRMCGFGTATGVDLPGEAPGLIPTTDYYDRRYGKNKWTKGLVLNNSIGQGEVLVTPLQLAQFFCGLANNGVVYRPHILKAYKDADGNVTTVEPQESFRLPFSSSTMSIMREGLRLVVEGEKGTARSLASKFYTLGGKTGTAENPHGENHSWFVGVAPLDNPEIVVCAIVENAGHGSDVAAPLVGQIIKAYMEKSKGLKELTVKDGVEQ